MATDSVTGISPTLLGNTPTDSRMRLISTIATAALLMSACASPQSQSQSQSQSEQPDYNLSGYPPAFRDGYVDGCDSTRQPASTVRDEGRFKTDSTYATGWRDGFDMCSQR